MTSRKIVMTVCTPWTVVSRSSVMSLIITFMFEPAKLQMNCASASGTSIRRRAGSGRVRSAMAHRGPGARAQGLAGVVELVVEVQRRGDQRQVGERLGEVADLLAGRVDLLRVHAEVVAVGEHLGEGEARVLDPPRARQRVDVEERAQRERALRAGQPVR